MTPGTVRWLDVEWLVWGRGEVEDVVLAALCASR
jgi:hypothetical protein